jgi:molybdate transport system ATP-binding protein
LAITGDSGAGKTTLLRCIAGLIHPSAGNILQKDSIWLDTEKRISCLPQNRNVGFVFQDYALFPHFTVEQNLRYALMPGQDPNEISGILDAVELAALVHRYPRQLSGGQQQRVALARALVRKPTLLLLDEPLAALDSSMRKKLRSYLVALRNEQKLTVLLVTHDVGEIFAVAERVMVMSEGKIVNMGTPREVFLPGTIGGGAMLYGEVLTSETMHDHLLVHALVQQEVMVLQLPLYRAADVRPGGACVIRCNPEISDIEML